MNSDYYCRKILVPANVAVSAMQQNGLPISLERADAQRDAWNDELEELQSYVQGEADKRNISLKYSKAHAAQEQPLYDLLYSSKGLGLEERKMTQSGRRAAMDSEALMPYAAVGANHKETDDPIVYAILKIRSIAKAKNTHLASLVKYRRADGCAHPHYKWNLPNTTRLSAENPPVHQIPEKADPEIAKLVKSCIVPREKPWLGDPKDWDPRKHGWIAKADVAGAEAVIRAGCIARCSVSVPYLRSGGDIHSRTASILYEVAEGTYKKGTPERDAVGKQTYFLLIFGGSWKALQLTVWKKARIQLEDDESKLRVNRFFRGYADLETRYSYDTNLMFERGYIEDYYSRRWTLPPPDGVKLVGWKKGKPMFTFPSDKTEEELNDLRRQLENRRHIYANKPTQTAQATTTLWCIALCHHGEYVDLKAPDYWNNELVFPEAAGWQLDEGPGPGRKPMKVWTNNTVHDALWFDGAPGYLEPAAKLITRRFNGVPAEFLIDANMPWRVEIQVGPDLGNLRDYNEVAKDFGLEPIPWR